MPNSVTQKESELYSKFVREIQSVRPKDSTAFVSTILADTHQFDNNMVAIVERYLALFGVDTTALKRLLQNGVSLLRKRMSVYYEGFLSDMIEWDAVVQVRCVGIHINIDGVLCLSLVGTTAEGVSQTVLVPLEDVQVWIKEFRGALSA